MAVPESVEIAAAFDPAFAVEDVAIHTFENAVKVQCMVIPDPDIVSFYRRQEMQVRRSASSVFDPGRGKPLSDTMMPFRISLSRINAA